MMRYNNLNWHDHSGYKEMTTLSLIVNATDEDKSKRIIMYEGLLENCSTDVGRPKRNIVNEILSQNNYADV